MQFAATWDAQFLTVLPAAAALPPTSTAELLGGRDRAVLAEAAAGRAAIDSCLTR